MQQLANHKIEIAIENTDGATCMAHRDNYSIPVLGVGQNRGTRPVFILVLLAYKLFRK